jgi:hypothetical protein
LKTCRKVGYGGQRKSAAAREKREYRESPETVRSRFGRGGLQAGLEAKKGVERDGNQHLFKHLNCPPFRFSDNNERDSEQLPPPHEGNKKIKNGDTRERKFLH